MHPLIGSYFGQSNDDDSPELQDWLEKVQALAHSQPEPNEFRRMYESLRRYSETRVERERTKLEAVIHSLGDGLVAFDPEGSLLFSNAAAQAHLGELSGQNVKRLLTERFRMRSPELGGVLGAAHLQEILASDLPFRSDDAELLWVGPVPLPVSCVLNPIRDDKRTVGWVFVFRDMSRPRRQEEEIERARTDAERANRAKSEFLAVMSHEIRTPMNGVIGMTSLLAETPLSEEQRDYTETIRRSGEALLSIIDDILDFSKVEAGHLELEQRDFDPRAMVEEVVELLADSSERKALELVGWIDSSVPQRLRGDPGRLRQILVNLVGNAIKFTHEGDVVVHVQREETTEGFELRFEVRDTGIGVPAADLEDIFQSFSQGSRPNRRNYGGTGLGLAISRRLVDLMHGRMGARPREGGGTTFWFTVMLDQAQGLGATPGDDVWAQDHRVLVACSNPMLRGMLNDLLVEAGAGVWTAVDSGAAQDALRAAAQSGAPFDLIILDSELDPVDGWHLASWMVRDPALSATHRLVLTTQRALLAVDPEVKQSASIHILKPARPRQLVSRVRGLLRPQEVSTVETVPQPPASLSLDADVLVVEDNAVSQRLAVLMLEKVGCRVEKASDGHEALAHLERRRFDLVLMDCQMPGLDGFETTRLIRKLEQGGQLHTPIVAMTASAMSEDRQACLNAGMDDYLTKPVRRDELVAALWRWLGVQQII